MLKPARLVMLTVLGFLSATLLAMGGEVVRPTKTQPASPSPTPIQDDANLHAVWFVGSQKGWAVGDHGVIWKTTDGGTNWQLVPSPVKASLRGICFLTDRVGWIVGESTIPHARLGMGIVLFTRDGGKTWTELAKRQLPQLVSVRFFNLNEGIVVGESSPDFPTGIITTDDGGKTWNSVPGKHIAGWRVADFLRTDIGDVVGAVAGLRGQISLYGDSKLQPTRVGNIELRGMRGVKLQLDGTGWLVGDGALVRKTTNGGIVWQSPPTLFPDELKYTVDFRALATHGDDVWIAGNPGSVIWHSPDGGRSWSRQFTGQTVPINQLLFRNDQVGWAVGALGMMLRTEDGGKTWVPVRGGSRRIALMAIHARPAKVSFSLLAKQSGDLGYRSLVLLPVRRDIGPDGHAAEKDDLQLHDAVVSAGGSGGEIEWQFPLAIPGLERNTERLVSDWNRRTDDHLRDALLGRLVCRLRTWRPNIIVVDKPGSDDAATQLLNDAITRAVEQAGDATRFVGHSRVLGLGPWQVQKLYQRLADGSTGHAHIDPQQYLPRLKSSGMIVAKDSAGKLGLATQASFARRAYRLVFDRSHLRLVSNANRDFFMGISLAPGSAARRQLLLVDERKLESQQKIARRQRNFQAYAQRYADDPRHAAQLIAQLRESTSGMSDQQAAFQLAQLADNYRRRSRWELAEKTLLELVERYPQQPVALEAMQWLLHLWIGAEPAWQRAKKEHVGGQKLISDTDAIIERMQKATQLAEIDPILRDLQSFDSSPDPLQYLTKTGRMKIDSNADWRNATFTNWHERAVHLAAFMRKVSPALYRNPQVQFPLAALLRQRGSLRAADRLYRRRHLENGDDLWKQTAAAELWLTSGINLPPKNVIVCRRTETRPLLDGVLSDACWEAANEIRLTSADQSDEPRARYAFAMLAYDREYLYFAATFPRSAMLPTDRPVLSGRKHDADLSRFDRVKLFLDVDRDYATFYSFSIDQRGWTEESCWNDRSFDPKWYVAADADDSQWRIEVAIPLEALVPFPPTKGTVWAGGILRIMPSVGLESWTHPASTQPRPESFGLIRFD